MRWGSPRTPSALFSIRLSLEASSDYISSAEKKISKDGDIDWQVLIAPESGAALLPLPNCVAAQAHNLDLAITDKAIVSRIGFAGNG